MAKEITDATFESDVLQSNKTVLLDFWAPWCGPCRQLLPIIDEISEEMKDKIQVMKCNVDENTRTPAKYGVRGIPALMIFKGGQVVANRTGATSKAVLTQWIEENL